MDAAIKSVKEGGLSVRTAAKTYGVPRSTLQYRLYGRGRVLPDGRVERGPKTVLTWHEENAILEYCLGMCKMGYGMTKGGILDLVQTFLQVDGRENPFTNGRPGESWWKGFLKRHPGVGLRNTEPLSLSRARCLSDFTLDKWFNVFEECLKEHGILDRADRIWNCDESGFHLCHRSGRVLAPFERRTCSGLPVRARQPSLFLHASAGMASPYPQ